MVEYCTICVAKTDADELRIYCAADLRLCFRICKKPISHEAHLQVGSHPAVFHGHFFSSSTDSRTAVTGERLGMKYLKNFLWAACPETVCLVVFVFFVRVEALRPSQQFFSHVGMEPPLLGYYQYLVVFDWAVIPQQKQTKSHSVQ